jgi:hypothetical protein
VKIGDKIRITGIPSNVRDVGDMKTQSLFQKCVGQTFAVAGIEQPEGVPFKLLRLDVGHMFGEEPYLHTIWIEEEFVELASSE